MKNFKYRSIPTEIVSWFTGTVMYDGHPKYGRHQLTKQQLKYASAEFKNKLYQNIKDAYESDDAVANKIDQMYAMYYGDKRNGIKQESTTITKKKINILSLYERAGKKGGMFDKEFEYTDDEKKTFMEAVRNFGLYGETIYRSDQLKEAIQEISELIELANGFTLKETDGWFDNVTATRHTKQMKEAVKVLQKEAEEILTRQQRLEAAYEDLGGLLNRYYKIER